MNRFARHRLFPFLGRVFFRHWQARLRVLLAGLILWQFAVWFDEYFLSATEWLVRAAIATVIMTEWFPRIRPVWRRLAAVLLLLALHAYRLDLSAEGIRFGEGAAVMLETAATALKQAAPAMHPFIWFALGTAAIHWLMAGWLTERMRIAFVTVSAVTVFAVVDSFSKLVLWEQAAITVFAGLGLLLVEHFDKFRRRHPASWAYLREYPGSIVVPAVTVLVLVMGAGALAPDARPLLTDPYTLYKHWKGERVVTGGKGFATDVTPAPSFQSNESGYSRDDRFLGEGFYYDFSEVMRITTSHPSYWRGEAKSFYTGAGWTDSLEEQDDRLVMAFSGQPLPGYEWETGPASGETLLVRQQVTMLGDDPDFAVLFGAPGLVSVRTESIPPAIEGPDAPEAMAPDGSEPVGIWSARQGELLRAGDTYPRIYGAESAVPVADEAGWRGVTMEAYADLLAENGALWAPYLQLPDTLPERVRRLAEEVSAEADTPYDKVKSIEQFLKTTYPYANRPDLGKGQSDDFVDRFLFEIREGYCDYFSTSMAVMVRAIGLPARWVKGFRTGIHEFELQMPRGYMPDQRLMQQLRSGEGTYIVRNADAHSWVEVYFPGYGWLPFEPTSGFTLPLVQREPEAVEASADVVWETDAAAGGGASGAPVGTGIAALVAAVALALIVALVRLARRAGGWAAIRRIRWNPFGSNPQPGLNEMALSEAGRILKWLGRRGYPRESHETIREAAGRWAKKNRWLQPDFETLATVVERARYSPDGVTAEDVAELGVIRKRLKEELK